MRYLKPRVHITRCVGTSGGAGTFRCVQACLVNTRLPDLPQQPPTSLICRAWYIKIVGRVQRGQERPGRLYGDLAFFEVATVVEIVAVVRVTDSNITEAFCLGSA